MHTYVFMYINLHIQTILRRQNLSGKMCPCHGAGGLGGRDVAPDSRLVCIPVFGGFTFPEAVRPLFWACSPGRGGRGRSTWPGPEDLASSSASGNSQVTLNKSSSQFLRHKNEGSRLPVTGHQENPIGKCAKTFLSC